jgi:broad specificity phosphatase PhoE
MRLIIIRHGDPNYAIDSLTEKGWKEAELLSQRIVPLNAEAFYVSPLGRARDTASVTLKKLNREAIVLPWLREFHAPIEHVRTKEKKVPWDWYPQDWTGIDSFYDSYAWHKVPVMETAKVYEEAVKVYIGLDEILKEHGYEREGKIYRAVKSNRDTIVFFCHFGVECVMLSHLLGISPMLLWHGFCAAPTSVTTLITEERSEGIAYFRMSSFGDISHLYAAGEEPAFAARFCETYDNMEERH